MREKHPLAGQTVKLKLVAVDGPDSILDGQNFWVEDWAQNIFEASWQQVPSRTTKDYAARIRYADPSLANDQDVVYGCFKSTAYLVHQSEILVMSAKQRKTASPWLFKDLENEKVCLSWMKKNGLDIEAKLKEQAWETAELGNQLVWHHPEYTKNQLVSITCAVGIQIHEKGSL